ncbi:Na(+)/H(+) antiporter subunit F [bacterium]|jgi:multisubunit Na+/H+ antiporter MnhF subunit|nr:Na(+)/H(+) antiporter subunit F [bacterium]
MIDIYSLLMILPILGLLFCLIRIIKGPSVFDRVLSLDGIAVCIVSIMILLSMKWKTQLYLDLILIFCVLGFFSTVAFCYYLEKVYVSEKESND